MSKTDQSKDQAPSCATSTERSEHLNAGSSPALEGLQGQGTESLVGTGQSPVGVNFLFDFAHKKWAEPQ